MLFSVIFRICITWHLKIPMLSHLGFIFLIFLVVFNNYNRHQLVSCISNCFYVESWVPLAPSQRPPKEPPSPPPKSVQNSETIFFWDNSLWSDKKWKKNMFSPKWVDWNVLACITTHSLRLGSSAWRSHELDLKTSSLHALLSMA